ncbi:alpha/beta hydrolase [Gammaproteobacteria bacterium]|nr:alpha/beta hydrolase [Gammaproteobacteria bacterium]
MKVKSSLFLLPGLLCDEVVWVEQVKALSPYADIIIPSFRGKNSLKDMAQEVIAQAPEKFSVVGHSMGARVALEIINIAPDRIDKIALMDTGVHPVQPGEKEKRQTFLDLANTQGMAAVARSWALPMVGSSHRQDEELMTEIYAMVERYTLSEYEGQLQALLGRSDQAPYLKNITQHVLLVCGDEDNWSPVSQHQEMLQALNSAELKIVKDSGHMVTMEQPEAVNKILVDWFCA